MNFDLARKDGALDEWREDVAAAHDAVRRAQERLQPLQRPQHVALGGVPRAPLIAPSIYTYMYIYIYIFSVLLIKIIDSLSTGTGRSYSYKKQCCSACCCWFSFSLCPRKTQITPRSFTTNSRRTNRRFQNELCLDYPYYGIVTYISTSARGTL